MSPFIAVEGISVTSHSSPWHLRPVSYPPPTSRCTKCSTPLNVRSHETPVTPRYASRCRSSVKLACSTCFRWRAFMIFEALKEEAQKSKALWKISHILPHFSLSPGYRRSTPPTRHACAQMQSACLHSMVARPSTTSTSSSFSSTTSSSSFGVQTLWQPWVKSPCRVLLHHITGPSRSLRISLHTPSSPLWEEPSG